MATGFEDDGEIVPKDEPNKTAVELTTREKAIAQGRNPDKSSEESEDVEEEAGDTEVDGKDAAATSSSEDDEQKDDAGGDEETWVSDSVKELADSYGIDEKSLASFENEKDFRRFAGILEKTIGKPEGKAKDAAQDAATEVSEAEDVLDVEAFESDGYDENTIKIVKSVAKLQGAMKSLLEQNGKLQQQLSAGERRRELDSLHKEIDTMGGRFGKSDSLTPSQEKSRAVLIDAIELVKQNLEKRGSKASRDVVLRRAELLAFGDEVLAEEKAKQKEALSQSVKKQSAKRRTVGRNTKQPTPRERPGEARDPVKAIANSPAVVEFWDNAQMD
jgi:hypothetical protein